MSEPVVVVGNGVSGYACAARLAAEGVAVTMIGPGLPHDRPPLSKRAIATGKVPFYADAAKLAELGIRHVDGLVTSVDLATRTLTVTPTAGDTQGYETAPRLVWATGFSYPLPPVPGIDGAAIQNHTAGGLNALYVATSQRARRIAVIGAGLIGTETAATLATAGHEVVLLDMLDRPLARLHPAVSEAAASTLADLGVRFCGACRIESVTMGDDGARAVATSTHGDVHCDVLVAAAGFRSTLPAALAPDITTLGINVDATLRVPGTDGVWACGDCVTFPHPRYGRIAIPHWDHAINSGRHAAESVMGSHEPYVREPYYFSDIGPLRVQQVGLAAAATTWRDEDGWLVGRDDAGRPAAVVFLNSPARLADARALIAGA